MTSAESKPSLYDSIWGYTDWYQNQQNPVVQSFQFTGRFQVDYAIVEADQGDHEEWNIRRFRVGGKAQLFRNFRLHGEADINPQEANPVYERLTEMNLAWTRSRAFVVTIGKQGAPFTLDGSTSSKDLITTERGNVANNLFFTTEYFPGLTFSGRPGNWKYITGLYSAGAADREFGRFSGGVFWLGNVGYDFNKSLGVNEALLSLNYVYNELDEDNTWTRDLQNVGSVNFRFDQGRWGLRTDFSAGTGYLGQSDLWGAMLMPFYNITDKFQVVARYTYLESQDNNGVRLALYENEVVPDRGDLYHEAYLGLNYYFYGHKLKLQTGAQYADMRDRAGDGGEYSGWAVITGLRLSW